MTVCEAQNKAIALINEWQEKERAEHAAKQERAERAKQSISDGTYEPQALIEALSEAGGDDGSCWEHVASSLIYQPAKGYEQPAVPSSSGGDGFWASSSYPAYQAAQAKEIR